MNSGIQNIRLANFADAEAITEVMTASRNVALPYLPNHHSRVQIQRWVEETVLNNSTVWIAEVNNKTVGFLALNGDELDHLYVHPDFWSKGIGSQLLALDKEQSQKLKLFTFQRNDRSRRFYEHHGFKLIELGDGSANEDREPDALYEWGIDYKS
jgi:GNAT superfamily N-acetyltransferase